MKQLAAFVKMLQSIRGAGALVKSFAIGLRETTETLVGMERPTLNELLKTALDLMPAVRELQAVDWMSTSFVLSDNATDSICRTLRSLRLSVLLGQINSTDFITYRLALLSRYTRLRTVEVMVLPYDPGASATTQFELFPAQDLEPPPLDMQLIQHVEALALGGPLCDQRVVNLLRAFRGLRDVSMYDSFASPHIAPALAALDPTALQALRLQRLVTTPPPVNLPFQDTDWTRFMHLRTLVVGMPLASDSLFAACPSFTRLEELRFGATSNPTVAQLRQVLLHRPSSLRLLELSNVTGDVGGPITPDTLSIVANWLLFTEVAQQDNGDWPGPIFPLHDWHLPKWTEGFSPSEAETLFPLARQVGVELQGSLLSALLTTFLLDRQIDVWQDQLVAFPNGPEVDEETKEVMCRREFWDALALRYKARLLGTGSVVQQLSGDQSTGAARSIAALLEGPRLELMSSFLSSRYRDRLKRGLPRCGVS